MSDERLRELERLVAIGDPEAKRLLWVEQQRLGLRFSFPPRYKVGRHDRPDRGWCHVCKQWSIVRPSQKQRSRRRRKNRLPTRFCTSLVRRDHPAAEPRGEYRTPGHPAVIGQLVRCRGPERGQDTTAPLEALEARLAELEQQAAWLPEVEWLRHRIKVTRRKLGIPEPSKPCEHPSSRLDYFDDGRRRVQCKDCQAVLDPETGRVVR
jgi:hypothetical protein